MAQITTDAPVPGRPEGVVNLATHEGVALVKGEWRYSDVKINEVDHYGPGPDFKATGKPDKTYDYSPHAGAADFDDSKWEVIDPTTLEQRRANGKLCFNWYRTKVEIPGRG
jgi:gluconolactonase